MASRRACTRVLTRWQMGRSCLGRRVQDHSPATDASVCGRSAVCRSRHGRGGYPAPRCPGAGTGAKRAERYYRSNRLIDDEVPVGDVDAAWYANLTAIFRNSPARMHTALGAVAGVTPRNQIPFPFEECIEVSVGSRHQRRAGIAPGRRDFTPILGGRVLQIVVDVKPPVTRRGPHYFDFGNQSMIHAEPRAVYVRG